MKFEHSFKGPFVPSLIEALVITAAAAVPSIASSQALIKCTLEGRIVYQATVCVGKAEVVGARFKQPFVLGEAPEALPVGRSSSRSLAEALRKRAEEDRADHKVVEHAGSSAAVLRERMGAL